MLTDLNGDIMNKMIIDCEYYADTSRISNSAIGWFNKKGPQYLRDMLDGKAEGISGKFLEKGTMIHEYILQPDEFWKDYEILDFEAPTVKQQKDFCEHYKVCQETDPLCARDTIALRAYRLAYANSLSDAVALTKANELVTTYSMYIRYLQIGQTKKIISFSDLLMLKNIKKNLKAHKAANELLWVWPEIESHNEFHINWEYLGIPCKSLLDRVIIDTESKQIIIVDLKTTVDVYNFKSSVEEYDYYRQIMFYKNAVYWYMEAERGYTKEQLEEFEFNAYIIAIQNNGNNEVRVFNMFNEEELSKREDIISNTIKEISYHVQSNNWEHTREYYENDGIEELK